VIGCNDIKEKAVEFGFDLAGIASSGSAPHGREFLEWLDRGYSGEMAYMGRSAETRADPRTRFPWAKSVISLAKRYPGPPPEEPASAPAGRVSCYALGEDYHNVLGGALLRLEEYLRAHGVGKTQSYVDTGPVLERDWAAHAGLGWIGKNTSLINQRYGSWIFLATVFVDVVLDADDPAPERCGTCTDCLEACPTGAILAPYVIDSRLCLSYLTIEFKGIIPPHLREKTGDWVFGCDICQAVCPWNVKCPPADDPAFEPRPGLHRLDLGWALSNPGGLSTLISGTAVERARGEKLTRNLLITAGNSRDGRLAAALEPYVVLASSGLAEQVSWAIKRLRS
jgi:epoxyqueuosine reductase